VPEETTPPEGTPSTPEAPNWDSPDNPYLKRFQDTQSVLHAEPAAPEGTERYEQDPQAYIRARRKHGVESSSKTPTRSTTSSSTRGSPR
jgi:hypothetical protein